MIQHKNLIKLQECIASEKKVAIAFVNEASILSTSTLKILQGLEITGVGDTKIGYIDVEENKDCFSKFSLRIIPTIHVYEQGQLVSKLNLPFTAREVACMIK